jgi:hypothetical protein
MAPLPVPRSMTLAPTLFARTSSAHSTSVSVSGRGTSTRGSTVKFKPKNSFWPQM